MSIPSNVSEVTFVYPWKRPENWDPDNFRNLAARHGISVDQDEYGTDDETALYVNFWPHGDTKIDLVSVDMILKKILLDLGVSL